MFWCYKEEQALHLPDVGFVCWVGGRGDQIDPLCYPRQVSEDSNLLLIVIDAFYHVVWRSW